MSTVPILVGIGGDTFCSVVLTDRGSRAGVCCRVSFCPISCDGARTWVFLWVSSVAEQFCGPLITNGPLIYGLQVSVPPGPNPLTPPSEGLVPLWPILAA